VRSHLKNLYRKLEVNSREDAVRAASRLRSLSGLPA
jgi:ATP/maltotriose-dependent transcriptional regulator MalT